MNIYLAGPWAHRERVRVVRDSIHAVSWHRVVSRWLDHVVTNEPGEQASEATHDLEDMNMSDVLVVMNYEKSEGKSFEQGYMFHAEKPIIIIGQRSHVFQHLPRITVVDRLDQALDMLDAALLPSSK